MSKIKELEKEVKMYNEKSENIKKEIENLRYELGSIYEKKDLAEEKIKKLVEEKKLKDENKRRNNLFKLTGDKFNDSLKQASLFCSLDDSDLSTIKLYKDKILATSGYMGIIIDAIIPVKYQNKSISWDLKNQSELTGQYLEILTETYQTANKNSKKEIKCKKGDILSELKPKIKEIDNEDTAYLFSYDDVNLVINTNFLDESLRVLEEDEELSLSLPSYNLEALTITSENKKIVIMPIRLSDEF